MEPVKMWGGGYFSCIYIFLGHIITLDGVNLIGESLGGNGVKRRRESVLLGCPGTSDMANGM
jgi:hypothetical protein